MRCTSCGTPVPRTNPRLSRCEACGTPTNRRASPGRAFASSQRGSSFGVGLVLGLLLSLGLAAAVLFLPRDLTVEGALSWLRGLPVIPPEGDIAPQEPDALKPASSPAKPSSSAKLSSSPGAPPSAGPRVPSSPATAPTGPDRSLARRTPCGLSSAEMDQVRDAHAAALLRCFQSEFGNLPRNVGLSSKWEVVIDGRGRVHRATPHLYAIDFKRSEEEQRRAPYSAPGKDAPAVRCAARSIESWSFSPYIANPLHLDLLMTCDLNLTLKEP